MREVVFSKVSVRLFHEVRDKGTIRKTAHRAFFLLRLKGPVRLHEFPAGLLRSSPPSDNGLAMENAGRRSCPSFGLA
jgi:hypothetical protein